MKVKSITARPYSGPVYDLSVEGSHSFIANGVRVHNCRCRITASNDEIVARGTDVSFWMGGRDSDVRNIRSLDE